MDFNTTVFETLSACLDPNPNIRLEAELKLKSFALNPEYALTLINIATAKELPFAQRQMAAITLKSLVSTHWSPKDEKFVGPEVPETTKAAVREKLLIGLSDDLNKIRVALAYAISRIAQHDWPESWPHLFDSLLENLRSGDSKQVHGAMYVLSEFIRNDITDQQFPIVAPVLFPELFKIFNEEKLYSPQTRARAVAIMRDFVEMLYTLKEEHPDAAQYYLGPVLDNWMTNMLILLKSNPNTEFGDYGLRLEVLNLVCKLLETFPKMISKYVIEYIPVVWSHITNLSSKYIEDVVNDGEGEFAEEHSDGESFGMENFLYILFEFFNLLASKKPFKSLFTTNLKKNEKINIPIPEGHNQQKFIEEIIYYCLIYMEMTQEQMDLWISDVNQYVQDEHEDTYSFNVRISTQELIVDCLSLFYPYETVNALINATNRHFQEGINSRNAGNPNWWKIHESCLLAIGRCSNIITDGVEQNQIQFDLGGLFNNVILEDIGYSDLPFLQGRTLWFVSQFAKSLPNELATQYVTAAVNALQPNQPFPVKISAVKALKSFCTFLENEKLQPFQSAILENMAPMVNDAEDDILFLILETFTDIIMINPETTAQYEPIIIPIIVNVWVKNCEDPLLCSFVTDLFEILAPNPGFVEPLQTKVVPVVMQSLADSDKEDFSGVATSCVELLTVLVKKCCVNPLPPLYIEQIFPTLIQLLSTTDDHSVLQTGQDYLKYMIHKALPQLIAWVDPNSGKNGVVLIVEFIAKMLDPSQSDNASIFLGDLINKLILKGGNDIAQILPDLLTAITRRVAISKNTIFIQSMICVFAQLIQSQMETVTSFLSQLNIEGKSGLEIILGAWCEHSDSFQGVFKTKLCTVSLSKLFTSTEQNLQYVMVQGDLIITENNGIMTRSKSKAAKQYNQLPFYVKAVKLLANEYQRSLQEEESYVEGYDEEDDAWEDDLAGEGDFKYLSEIVDYGYIDDDEGGYEEEDEDIKNDPIYQIKINEYLQDFFRKCASANVNNFMGICEQFLNDSEKKIIQGALN
ncbi:ARM repeat-containing protein [Piromyces finnis]|uniref:ARM repeat-containing protein n=1 Tax=Piromyces finnis TaxID=1754191 RepID=A0A1Y1V9R1_9FUNG|nr:ARM repeat-containing protein [Piromyces finnis]|eukprot:ORX50392.1 ARM repeat-containing protein [Piromyces finnis]